MKSNRYAALKIRIVITSIIFLTLLITDAELWSMPQNEHISLWNKAFGVTDAKSANAIQPLWREAQDIIDKTDNVYKNQLQRNFSWFHWGTYGHRLLFHWGFNINPESHPPMQDQVKTLLKKHTEEEIRHNHLSIEDAQSYSRKQEKAFYDLLKKIQGERNRRLIRKVSEVMGIPTTNGNAAAVATVIYDVHLLGDYSTTNTKALPKLDVIAQDLQQNGFERLLRLGDSPEILREMSKKLEHEIRAIRKSSRPDPVRAELLIDVTRVFFPQILNERFKNTLQKKGITIESH